jgi:multicomponent Na+:H+ antiporter subunit E
MGYSSKAFLASLKKLGAMLHYLGVLMLEIIKSNIAVIKLIWRKEAPQPNLVHFKTKLKSDAFKVLVANSITLTPGTYTVVLDGQDYAVHALDASFNEGMEENVFFQMTEKMEG